MDADKNWLRRVFLFQMPTGVIVGKQGRDGALHDCAKAPISTSLSARCNAGGDIEARCPYHLLLITPDAHTWKQEGLKVRRKRDKNKVTAAWCKQNQRLKI